MVLPILILAAASRVSFRSSETRKHHQPSSDETSANHVSLYPCIPVSRKMLFRMNLMEQLGTDARHLIVGMSERIKCSKFCDTDANRNRLAGTLEAR